jgi:hypothetical protein
VHPQAVLDGPAETLVGMERAAHPSHPENGRGLASCRLAAVLEVALAGQASGRQKTCEPGGPGLDRLHGGGESNLGSSRIHGELLKFGFDYRSPRFPAGCDARRELQILPGAG